MKTILVVFGTRPEAIKLAPVIRALQRSPTLDVRICVTGQHRAMLDQVLSLFEIQPDVDLQLMTPGQDLTDITSKVLVKLRDVLTDERPDCVSVQGDTATAMAAALAGFYAKIPVAHVEAGLRTDNLQSPWPEELNRRIVTLASRLHFCPTEVAANNLRREGIVEASIEVTGNTVIDALLDVTQRIQQDTSLQSSLAKQFCFLDSNRRLILVTGHRRENFGPGLESICQAIVMLSRRDDVQIVYPVHRNPNVQSSVHRRLGNCPNVTLLEPLDYVPFVDLMTRADIILTDSGGVQEEAPPLGKPVLVMRDTTERPEGVAAGTVKLVGTDCDAIVAATTRLLDDRAQYAAMAQAVNPYGDGHAAERIVARLVKEFCV